MLIRCVHFHRFLVSYKTLASVLQNSFSLAYLRLYEGRASGRVVVVLSKAADELCDESDVASGDTQVPNFSGNLA